MVFQFFLFEKAAILCYKQYTSMRNDWDVYILEGVNKGKKGWYVIYGNKKRAELRIPM